MALRKFVALSLLAATLTATPALAQDGAPSVTAPGTVSGQGGTIFVGLLPGGPGWTAQPFGLGKFALNSPGPVVLMSNPALGLAYLVFTAHPQRSGIEGQMFTAGLCATRVEPTFTFAPGTTFSVVDQDGDGISEIFVATPTGDLIVLPEGPALRGCDVSDIG